MLPVDAPRAGSGVVRASPNQYITAEHPDYCAQAVTGPSAWLG